MYLLKYFKQECLYRMKIVLRLVESWENSKNYVIFQAKGYQRLPEFHANALLFGKNDTRTVSKRVPSKTWILDCCIFGF